jgi:hypothetical protein
MSHEVRSSVPIVSQIRKLLGLSGDEAERDVLSMEALLRRTRAQLIECARYLDLTGVRRLTKAVLLDRLERRLRELGILAAPEPEEPLDRSHRFDLGRPTEEVPPVEHIPWGYGQDRVTAMVVDPENLYVYWELTDGAIERARASLGDGGQDSALTLRIYDVTNRIFDGTNAHGYFDHRVERTDRQWFFFIGKPTSTAIVELGLATPQGSFSRIVRSGRADFPRQEPGSGGPVEWLTVRAATGEVGEPARGPEPPAVPAGAPPGGGDEVERVWDIRLMQGAGGGEGWPFDEHRWEEWVRALPRWGEHAFEWQGPIVETAWEAGPFAFPVEAVSYVEERHDGSVTVQSVGGRTRVVYGPWQVIIRGLGARAERRVLAVWEIHRVWASRGGEAGAPSVFIVGGSEQLALGASERLWLEASEVRLGGASEIYRFGASELRYGGASEKLYGGASERRLGGASERRLGGASEGPHVGAATARRGR